MATHATHRRRWAPPLDFTERIPKMRIRNTVRIAKIKES